MDSDDSSEGSANKVSHLAEKSALKINDLPLDVMYLIFQNFQDDALTEDWDCHRGVSWHDYRITQSDRRRRTVCNLRLVCRLFYELATPLLFPVLRVQLTRASLDLVEKISQAPDITAGVRGIQISLGYRPKEYADDIVRFMEARLRVLWKLAKHCSYDFQPYQHWEPEGFDESSQEGEVRRAAELRRALGNYTRLRDEWKEYVRATGRRETLMAPLPEYQNISQKGHAEYCRLQKEQQDLLQNGNFANTLAAAASRMPNVHCVNLVDEWHPNAPGHDHVEWLNNNRLISQLMPAPLTFREVEEEPIQVVRLGETICNLECVTLLWELPIALHRAGVSLKQLWIRNLPVFTNFSMLCAQNHNGAPAWDELAAACKTLESFNLDIANCKRIRKAPLPEKDKSHLDNFLGAILSRCAQHLRILKLDLYDMSINTGKCKRFEGAYRADSVLSKLQNLPRIRHLSLGSLELEGETLNALCRGLGNDLWRLALSSIAIRNGVWADALDMLRNKMADAGAATGPGQKAWASLGNLHGGEFSVFENSDNDSLPMGNPLEQAAEKYVEGFLDSNPLKGPSLKDICTCAYGIQFPCITHI
ncbi:hypothetical protein B0I37DRAFT_431622 [Chaetomium sp. MPI-CAGE-AT-0009]|nr:hypothetical protein B0I37DRAFT_431622 [Chaetomium sp. MPI-CAGE-AT-0009]